jgi:ribosomal protein L19
MVVVIIKTTIIQGDGLGESVVNIYTYIKRDLRVRERGSIRKSIKYYLESREGKGLRE